MTPIRMHYTSSGPKTMPANSSNHDNSGLFTGCREEFFSET